MKYKSPVVTVDIIIRYKKGIVLIKRGGPPSGWALPGGFVDYGESLEDAARREAKEETGLDIRVRRQFHTYSDPKRDRRFHSISTVYIAEGKGQLIAGDDACKAGIFNKNILPSPVVFDHKKILEDYFLRRY